MNDINPTLRTVRKSPRQLGFDRKLGFYALAGGLAFTLPQQSQAGSIAYSGPQNITVTNSVGGTETHGVDVNGDGFIDFTFAAYFDPGVVARVNVTPGAGNAGDSISSSSTLTTSTALLRETWQYGGVYGKWGNGTPSYLGLRFLISDNDHYGWAKVSVTTDLNFGSSFTIHDWAYQTQPDTAILAGEIGEIPEPSSLALFALGAAGFAALRKRRTPLAA
ncbi:MAG: PEP-CTERM sorting domain-containing protein [Bryobacteraceae bacterium]